MWKRAVFFYLGLGLLYGWPIVLAINSRLPSDIGDPGLNTWILWWNSQAVPFTDHWWNAPMFFPAPGAFALSETLLGVAPLTIPLHLSGVSPVAVYNLIFLVSAPAAAIAAHALAYELTNRHDASVIAGAAFGFSPYRVAQMPHLQMELACFMPLILLALHRYSAHKRARYLVLAGTCWLLNALMSGYYLMFFAVLLALWGLWYLRTLREIMAVGGTFAAWSLPLIPLLMGYHRYQSEIGVYRGIREIESFSADLSAIWAASPFTTLSSHWTLRPRPEGELYPGVIVLAMVAVASLVSYRRSIRASRLRLRTILFVASFVAAATAITCALTGGGEVRLLAVRISLTRPYKVITIALWLSALAAGSDPRLINAWRRRSPFLFYTVAAAAMFLFALGPVGYIFGERFLYKAPYSLLLELPGGDALRVPARFGMLFVLCLSQAAALGFVRIIPPSARTRMAVVLVVLVLLDGWVFRLQTAAVPPVIDLSRVDPKAVVIELPVIDEYSATAALLRATHHGHPVANGYSGYGPPHQFFFETGLRDLDSSVISAFQQLGPVAVFVAADRDTEGGAKRLMDGLAGAEHIASSSGGHLYRLPAQRLFGQLQLGHPLPIDSIVATHTGVDVSSLHDGNLTTRWRVRPEETLNDRLEINLREAAPIESVQIDLGAYRTEYPRQLRLDIISDSGRPRTVWDGGAAGLAMFGVLSNYMSPTMTIDVVPSMVGRKIVLIVPVQHPPVAWSVADIRVIGQ